MRTIFTRGLLATIIIATVFAFGSVFWATPAKADSTSDLIELFITLGIIPADRAESARSLFSTSATSATSSVPLYGFYNTPWKSYFYTASVEEKNALVAYPEWVPLGIIGYIYQTQITGTVPMYRLYNSVSGDHLYTVSESEKTSVSAQTNWIYEGITGYINSAQVAQTLPVTRLYNNISGLHYYTTNLSQKEQKLSVNGWVNQGIMGYIVPGPTVPLSPTGLYASCPVSSRLASTTLVWNPTLNATYYSVKIDSRDNATTTNSSFVFTATANATSTWSVSACNANGCSVPAVGTSFVCSTTNNNVATSTNTLTVSKSGDGRGTVTGGGISCGTSCSQTVATGTVITLTATPASGSVFAGWSSWSSSGCSGTISPCSITLSSNKAAGAIFNLIQSSTVACTSFVYSDWGSCVNGTKSRTVSSSIPASCTGGVEPSLTDSCVAPELHPSITITSPNGGETFYSGSNLTAKYSLVDTSEQVLAVSLFNLSGQLIAGTVGVGPGGVYTHLLPANTPTGSYKIRLQMTSDNGTKIEDTSDNYFWIYKK